MIENITAEEYLRLANYSNSIGDFCFHYYENYIEENSKEQALKNFIKLLNWDKESEETLELEKVLPEDEYQQITTAIAPITQKILDNLVIKNLNEHDFYEALFEKITDSIIFSKNETVCTTIILLVDGRIPYFELDEAVKMDEEEFQSISKSIEEQIKKAYFIIEYGYEQKTEIASQLHKLIEKQTDEKNKIVLLSNIIGYFDKKFELLLNSRENNNEDDEE